MWVLNIGSTSQVSTINFHTQQDHAEKPLIKYMQLTLFLKHLTKDLTLNFNLGQTPIQFSIQINHTQEIKQTLISSTLQKFSDSTSNNQIFFLLH